MDINVELTEAEKNSIKLFLKREIETANEDSIKAFMSVIDKAEALEEELDAIDEVMATEECSLIKWFINKIGLKL
ncbi:MAG: hypothetical protein HUJ96_02950 [Marinilabiliaceae bacterium]|nr:hypothetical protein [Marinilabiliaceae bacterium]